MMQNSMHASLHTELRMPWAFGVSILFFSLNNVALVPIMDGMSLSYPLKFLFFASMALIGTQMALHAVWCVFAPFSLVTRLAGGVIVALLLFNAWLLGLGLSTSLPLHLYFDREEIPLFILCAPLVFVAIQSPLWAAKFWLGWRVTPLHDRRESPPRAYGVRDLLIATAFAAALFSAARLAVPANTSAEAILIPLAVTAAVLAAVSLSTVVPVFLAVLRARRIMWALGGLSLYAIIVTLGTTGIIVISTGTYAWFASTMVIVYLVSLAGCMLLARWLGLRLQWGRPRQSIAKQS